MRRLKPRYKQPVVQPIVPVVLETIPDLPDEAVRAAAVKGYQRYLEHQSTRYVLEIEQVARHAGRNGDYMTKLDALKYLHTATVKAMHDLYGPPRRGTRVSDEEGESESRALADLSDKSDDELLAALPQTERAKVVNHGE